MTNIRASCTCKASNTSATSRHYISIGENNFSLIRFTQPNEIIFIFCNFIFIHRKIHAFIYDATPLEYHAGNDEDCDLITVGEWYAMTGYGVGFPRGSPWVEEVDQIILNLQKTGNMSVLHLHLR